MKTKFCTVFFKTALVLLFLISAGLAQDFTGFSKKKQSVGKSFDIEKVRAATADRGTGKDNIQRPDRSVPSMGVMFGKILISLSIILLLLAGTVYLFRRFTWKGNVTSAKSGVMDVLETTSIMPGKSLSIVRVADRVLLLGIFQEGIRCLSEFEGEKALEIIQATDKGNGPSMMTQFSDNLNQFMGKFKGKSA